jgi:outer membrane immunogenic protein
MKKIVLLGTTALAVVVTASAALAADMPTKVLKAPPYVAVPFDWTGFYIGAHVGSGWATTEWSEEGFTEGNYNLNGFLGGGQIGYNWQSGWAVWGVEADASLTDIKGGSICFGELLCRSKIDSLGTITARFGGTVDRALVYVKGGGAWMHEKHTITFGDEFAESKTRWGWAFGTGVEYAFAPNWSGKVEYNFLDFGKSGFFADVFGEPLDARQTVHTVKFGINYHFGGPMTGRY